MRGFLLSIGFLGLQSLAKQLPTSILKLRESTISADIDHDAHRMHSEMEKINPQKLHLHPSIRHSSSIRSTRSLETAEWGEEIALPSLTVDHYVLPSCLGGRVHVNLSIPVRFPRNNTDWVGLYSPADADINTAVPVKMATLGNITHFATSYGGPGPPGYLEGTHNVTQLKFDLVNLRGDYRFVFFSSSSWWYGHSWFDDDPASAVAVAASDPVTLSPTTTTTTTSSSSSSGGGSPEDDCLAAGVRPRVLPHIDAVTRRAVAGSWDVVWTSGSVADASTDLFYGDTPGIACSSAQLIQNSAPITTTATSTTTTTKTTTTTTTEVVVAESSSYAVSDLCGAPANSFGWFDPGTIHTATLVDIEAGSTVYYCFDEKTTPINVASEDEASSSSHGGDPGGVYSFKAPPATKRRSGSDAAGEIEAGSGNMDGNGGDEDEDDDDGVPFTVVAAFADFGRGTTDDSDLWHEYGSPAVGTAELLGSEAEAGTIHAVAHFGDISYATGYLASWDYYLDMVASFTSKLPYMINMGNHEYNWYADEWVGESAERPVSFFDVGDSGGECGVPTATHVPLPLWWSADIGAIHIIAMCTEVNFTRGSPQWEWLLSDLSSVNRSLTPWVMFGGHRPMYIDSSYGGNPTADLEVMALLIKEVEPLIVAFNVTLALWGHNHAVQRQCACLEGACAQPSTLEPDGLTHLHTHPPAPVHMVVGTGGASFTKNAYGAPFNDGFVDYVWGYARITAHNGSYLSWEFVDSQQQVVEDGEDGEEEMVGKGEEKEEAEKDVDRGGGKRASGSKNRVNGGGKKSTVRQGVVVDRMAIKQDPAAIVASIRERNPYADYTPSVAPTDTTPAPAVAPPSPLAPSQPPSSPPNAGSGGGGSGSGGVSAATTKIAVGAVCGVAVFVLVAVVGRLAFTGRLSPTKSSYQKQPQDTGGGPDDQKDGGHSEHSGVEDGDSGGKSALLQAFDAAYSTRESEMSGAGTLSTIEEERQEDLRSSSLAFRPSSALAMSDV